MSHWFPELTDEQYGEIMDLPVIGRNAPYRRYAQMRHDGQSHNMALLLATGSFPATRTDVEFNRGRTNGNQFEKTPRYGDWLRAQAEAAGVSTTGKHYCAGLADFPGDPTAWISNRGDVERVCREKNFTCHGAVEHVGHESEPMADVSVAGDILDAEIEEELERDPGLNREDHRERLVALRSGAIDPNEPLVSEPTEHYF
jgi:hypothetical protein